MDKQALEGLHFAAGDMLYRIADLSTVWLLADVYEQDLAQIRPGDAASITVQAYPGRVFEGRVAFVYPTVNAQTRTAKVRIEAPNPDLLLKTDMYATVEIAALAGSTPTLAVPDSAVLDTGTRQTVLIDRGEMAETEYVVRGRGYLRNTGDLEQIALKMQGGTPVLLRDVARVELGPEERRGIAELNGQGEVVSGIALQRDGQNALHVIDSVKQKLAEITPSLPKGVHVEAVYDRSDLIHRAIETLRHTLTEESIIVALVCIVFLLHVRSALVAILMLPVGVLIALGLLHALGFSSNIMSLGGIAIALGAMVDAAIVMIENAPSISNARRPAHRGRRS